VTARTERRRPARALGATVAVALLLTLVACSSSSDAGGSGDADAAGAATRIAMLDEAPSPELPVTVESYDGRQVEVTDASRILPLSPALSETVFTLGLGDNAVGRDIATTFEEAADLPVVTKGHDVSAEGVLSLEPTVVLADSTTGPPETLQQIRDSGVPVVVVEQSYSLDGVDDQILAVAKALGVEEAGQEVVRRSAVDVENVAQVPQPDGRKPKVAFLYVRGSVSLYLIGGEGSGADDLLEAVGAEDVGASLGLKEFTPLTPEAMIEAAPDVILVMTKGLESVGGVDGIVELPGVALTPAGKDKAVVAVEDGQLLAFGPRTAQTLTLLSEKLTAELS
jgi:iron complex transport system substrate-binding protein